MHFQVSTFILYKALLIKSCRPAVGYLKLNTGSTKMGRWLTFEGNFFLKRWTFGLNKSQETEHKCHFWNDKKKRVQQTSTFYHSFILMSRGSQYLLASKCQTMKVANLNFSNILLHKRTKKEMLQLSSSSISRPMKIFWLNLNENPLTSI